MSEPLSPTSIDLDRALAAAGTPAASFARLWQSLWVAPYVSAELLELCRLTLARLHRDAAELGAPNPHLDAGTPGAARRAAVLGGIVHRTDGFSGAERAVLQFAECYGLDAQRIPDETADAVKASLGEAGLVFLIEALGCLDGRIRTARCLRDLGRSAAGVHA
ncbi:MAG: hypothetical protein JSS29_08765 [Proteobacteria bacterium]|nr:hypothetical protein [Pseudomonadota bacterium]